MNVTLPPSHAKQAYLDGFVSTLEKHAQHTFITGHSGAGKSTLADQMGKKLKLPVYHLDNEYQRRYNVPNGIPKNEGDATNEEFMRDLLGRLDSPAILEGTHIAHVPEVWPGNKLVLVDTPEEAIVARRYARDVARDKVKGTSRAKDIEERRRVAKALIEALKPAIERYRRAGAVAMQPKKPARDYIRR